MNRLDVDDSREAVEQVQRVLNVSERRACRVMGQPRGTQRYEKRPLDDEEQLRERIVYLASRFGRYPVPARLDGVATAEWQHCCKQKAGR